MVHLIAGLLVMVEYSIEWQPVHRPRCTQLSIHFPILHDGDTQHLQAVNNRTSWTKRMNNQRSPMNLLVVASSVSRATRLLHTRSWALRPTLDMRARDFRPFQPGLPDTCFQACFGIGLVGETVLYFCAFQRPKGQINRLIWFVFFCVTFCFHFGGIIGSTDQPRTVHSRARVHCYQCSTIGEAKSDVAM